MYFYCSTLCYIIKKKDPKILSLELFKWRFRYLILIRSNGNCAEKAMHSSSLYRERTDVSFFPCNGIDYKGLKQLCLLQYFNAMITAFLDIWMRQLSVSMTQLCDVAAYKACFSVVSVGQRSVDRNSWLSNLLACFQDVLHKSLLHSAYHLVQFSIICASRISHVIYWSIQKNNECRICLYFFLSHNSEMGVKCVICTSLNDPESKVSVSNQRTPVILPDY